MSQPDLWLEVVTALPVRQRVAFCLLVAERVTPSFAADARALSIVRDALVHCWRWVGGSSVSADDLAAFVEGPREKNVGMLELEHSERRVVAGLIAASTAVQYTAFEAFRHEGRQDMPDSIDASDESCIQYMIEKATKTGCVDDEWVATLAAKIAGLFGKISREDLGPAVIQELQ